jgi:hypothetical protein
VGNLVEEHYRDLGFEFWGFWGRVAHQSEVPHGGGIRSAGNKGDGAVRWFTAASAGTDGFTALMQDLRRRRLDRTGT